MARPIDAVIRLRDRFTPVLRNISREMQQHSRQHQRMGRDIARTGRSMSALGKAMVPVAGTIVAAGAGAVATFAQFDDVMLAVKAKTGANVEQFEALRKKAKELGATTRFSASEAAKGMDYLAMAGYNVNQIIAAMPGLLNLAAASGTDLATVSDIVSDVMTAFGWAAKRTEEFADIMAYTTSKSNTSVEIMGETFKYVASTAKAAGVSAQETAAAIGLMANSGVKGSMAGTALRGALTRLLTQPKACAEAMGALNMSVTDSSGKFVGFRSVIEQFSRATKGMGEAERTAYAANLFGQEAMSGMLGMIDQGVDKFDELHNGILNSAGASKEMADIMNSGIGGAMASAKSAMESLALTVGDKLAPYVMQGSQAIIQISQALSSVSPETMDLAIKVAGAVIAFMAFNLIMGSVITKCGNAITTFGKISSGIKEAGSVAGYLKKTFSGVIAIFKIVGGAARLLFMNPVGLAVLAVIAAVVLIYKYWGPIKDFFLRLFENIKQYLQSAGVDFSRLGKIWDNLKTIFSVVVKVISGLVMKLYGVFKSVVGFLAKVFMPVFKYWQMCFNAWFTFLTTAFSGIVDAVLSGLAPVLNGVMMILNGVTDFIAGVFTGDWSKAWNGVVEIFDGIFKVVGGVAKTAMNVVIALINGAIAGINTISFTAPDWVPVVGGQTFQPSLPQLPMLYKGTENWRGGPAMIHDRGAEIVDLPRGSRVYPHDRSIQLAMREGVKAGMNLPRQENRTVQTPKVINLAAYKQRQEQQAEKAAQGKAGVSVTIAKLADTVIVREEADIEKIAKRSAQYVAAEIKKAHDNAV